MGLHNFIFSLTAAKMSEPTFKGWHALDEKSIGNMVWKEFTPRPWTEDAVDIEIQYCGICASDLHTASGGWGTPGGGYPQIVGHEIVGKAIRVGKDVKHIKEGDVVGVGAQNDSCLTCGQCSQQRESYCENGMTGTYGGTYKRENAAKGHKSYGGYATHHRAPGHFVLKIPNGLDPALAAPMMCGGVTVYAPLKEYGCGTTAKEVGIIGIGGLGHFGLLFAKALGANVTAISHSESKRADAEKMGASHFIATHAGDKAFEENAGKLDLIIATTNDTEMPLMGYLSLLKAGGTLVFVGAPEKPLPPFPTFALISKGLKVAGSLIGSPAVIQEMLDLAAKQDVKSWIIKRPMSETNQAVVDMENGKARYRFVLEA